MKTTQTQEKSEYDIQAENFLAKTKTEFSVKFIEWGLHFQDDKEKRDIYEITLKRGDRSFTFKFGQSTACSGQYILYDANRTKIHLPLGLSGKPHNNIKGFGLLNNGNSMKNKEFKAPSPYDVLACLTKYDCGDFENFCADFGYDTDSIKAEKTYKAVKNEYESLCRLYNDKEMELLGEIQ
jgi:hypothetical protein